MKKIINSLFIMIHTYKHLLLPVLLSLWIAAGSAQTPQLNFSLTTNESGTTKDYVARDSIKLGNGFRYIAVPGLSFRARIDITIPINVPPGTVINGIVIQPGSVYQPDGTITEPDGTKVRPDGTQLLTNGTIINPDGTVAPNISLIIPQVWFKTIPVTGDINGRYQWKDFSPNNVPLVKYTTSGTGAEYTVAKDSVMNFNFNPAIDLSSGNISKEIMLGKSNLSQTTVIGVWGSRREATNTDRFIFAINGRRNEGVLFSKNHVYSSVESGEGALAYGNDTVKNLLCLPTGNTSAKKARESSLRVATFYKSNMPNSSVWGEQQKASITLGSSFTATDVNNTSTFSSGLNNFAGFKGYTPELLVFGKVLTAVERTIFESYLALKYGVSMDQSYLSGTGRVIWDYNSNVIYNNRITGYGREDLIGLNQKMATSSYQEAPYYSDSCDSYLANGANNLSARNRLLVMGCESMNPLSDGEYVLFGDDNNTITATNTSMPGYKTMQRKWLVTTNRSSKNRIELSYFDSLATGFASHKNETYLIIDRTGNGEFNSSSDAYLMDSLDNSRSKIIFKNIAWNTDLKNVFTFGYKLPANGVKKALNTDSLALKPENSCLSIYYKNMKDLSIVTVKLKLTEPSNSTVLMFDLMGKVVYKQDLPSSNDVQYLDIKLPNSGVYIIKAITNEGELSTKVMSKVGY